mgnify:CR=1 FL=1
MVADGRLYVMDTRGAVHAYAADTGDALALLGGLLVLAPLYGAPALLAREVAKARGRGKPVVAAFGALHLPGKDGVLRLLERDGWTITAGGAS